MVADRVRGIAPPARHVRQYPMPLAPATRLGPYEIVSPLGARGMGEVYRARDARLDRTVAIKILPRTLVRRSAIRAERNTDFEKEKCMNITNKTVMITGANPC
jgi:serine/threonine protein kinase